MPQPKPIRAAHEDSVCRAATAAAAAAAVSTCAAVATRAAAGAERQVNTPPSAPPRAPAPPFHRHRPRRRFHCCHPVRAEP